VAKNKTETTKEEVKQGEDAVNTDIIALKEKITAKIDEYFKMRMEKGLPFNLEGICLHLNLDWGTFIEYLNKDDAIGKVLKRAYLIIKEERATEVARVSSTNNVEGNWLLLKNMNDYGCKYE
jgi:hypothetical protein